MADGTPGTYQKVRRIRQLVEKAKRAPDFRDRVAELLAGVAEKDHDGEISALVEHVRRGIRYMRDPYSPVGLELFVEPETMLQDVADGRAAGDCDDHVLLASAMLETAGYATRYRIGGLPPDRWRHIWIDVQHPNKGWLPVELTKKDKPIGWDPSSRFPMVETLGALTMRKTQADVAIERELRRKGISPRSWYQTGGQSSAAGDVFKPQRLEQTTRVAPASRAQRVARAAERVSADVASRVAQRRGARLGELPPSFANTHPVAYSPVPVGSTPIDFYRAVETGHDVGSTFGRGIDADEVMGLGFIKKLRQKMQKVSLGHRLLSKSPLLKKSPLLQRLGIVKKPPPRAPAPPPQYAQAPPVPAPGVEYSHGVAPASGMLPYPYAQQQPMPYAGQGMYSYGSGYVSGPAPAPAPMPPPVGPYVPPDWAFAEQYPETDFLEQPSEADGTYNPGWGPGAGDSGPVEYFDEEQPMEYGTFGGADFADRIGLGFAFALPAAAFTAATAAATSAVTPASGSDPAWWQSLLSTGAQIAAQYGQQKLQAKGYLQPAPPPAPPPKRPALIVSSPPPPPRVIMQQQQAGGGMMAALPWIAGAAALLLVLKRR